MKARAPWFVPLALAATLALGLLALVIGPGELRVGHVIEILRAWILGDTPDLGDLSPSLARTASLMVIDLRLARVLLVALLGAALGAGGTITQGLFRNPMAEPGVLGVSMGAAAAAVVGFAFGLDTVGLWTIPLLAAAGATATLLVLFALVGVRSATGTLLLSGIALGALCSATITLVLALNAHRWDLGIKVVQWLMGSFESRSWPHLAGAVAPCVAGLTLATWLRKDLDLLHLGDATASSLGVDLPRARVLSIVAVALLVGAATAIAGVIGFFGPDRPPRRPDDRGRRPSPPHARRDGPGRGQPRGRRRHDAQPVLLRAAARRHHELPRGAILPVAAPQAPGRRAAVTLRADQLGQSIEGRELFRGLDLRAEPGTITAVIGPNGSGKSTLLRKLAGLEPADHGRVELDGAEILGLPVLDRARRIAYLPQSTPLYHDLGVRELVMLGRAPHVGRFAAPSKADDEAVIGALERVGVAKLAERGLFSLSGGERQRVMLARMLCTGAPILVLDEPTTALDIGHALSFLELCRSLAGEGSTLVIAMHDLDRARRYAQQGVCLGFEGGAVRVGPVEDIIEPATLSEVFGVQVSEATRLVFEPKVQKP